MCESTIKKGALVKAWSDGYSDYVIGLYDECYPKRECHPKRECPHEVDVFGIGLFAFENAIEIPEELAKQLEELGK